MGEDYVIEVLSTEWIINSILSLLYMSIVLFIGFKLNNEKRLLFAKFISYSLILFSFYITFFISILVRGLLKKDSLYNFAISPN